MDPLSLSLFFVAGLLGGLLLGLIGVGMALITVPLLTFALPYVGFGPTEAPLISLATSMAIVSIGSVSSVVSHHRLGNIDWAVARGTIPASLIGVALGSMLATHLPGVLLRWIFGLFLVFVAIRMALPRKKKAGEAKPHTGVWHYRAAGGLIGLAGALIGAGGGVFMVPFLNSRGHPMPRAAATSVLIGLPVTVVGALIYAFQPTTLTAPNLTGYLYLPAFIGLGLGSIVAAPFGARLSSRVPADLLKRGFAAVLLILAAKMLVG